MLDTKKFLGARIQEIRKQQCMKQSDLAEKVNIDPKHLSKIECGRCYPSFELLDKIAIILNKPAGDFLNIEHLQNRDVLLDILLNKLKNTSDENLRKAYKILNEIL